MLEEFTGANGAAWPSSFVNRAGTTSIQGNMGRQVTPATTVYSSARADATAQLTLGDTKLVATFRINSTASHYLHFGINGDGTGTAARPNNGYVMQLDIASGTAALNIFENVAGAGTYLAWAGQFPISVGTLYTVIFERVGQVLRTKAWPTGTTEPGTWGGTHTIAGTPRTGRVSLGIQNAETAGLRQVEWDNVQVNYVPATAPVATPMPTPTWADEFTGTSLSLATETGGGTWRTRGADDRRPLAEGSRDYAGMSWNISPAQHPNDIPWTVADGVLTLTTKRASEAVKATAVAAGTPVTWQGPYLVSNNLTGLQWTYGYFEWCMALENPGRGMFPALWLYSNDPNRADGKQGAEIDVMEVFGDRLGQPWYSTLHKRPVPDQQVPLAVVDESTTGFHRYGIRWSPTKIELFLDGVLRGEISGADAEWFAGTKLGIRMNYSVDATWTADAVKTTPTDPPVGHEFKMKVKYVRYWATPPSELSPGISDDPGLTAPYQPPVVPVVPALEDRLNQSFTSGSTTSQYHFYGAGRSTGKPLGLVIQLHGDGAGEFPNPTSGVLAGYNAAALAQDMYLLAPRTPDRQGSWTWWENTSSPVWLLALLDHIRATYDIDETKIWFMGYSGGAEVQSYFLLSDYSNRIGSGGNIMLAGGGASGLVFGRQPTAAFKATQRLHWAVGQDDTDDGTGWNAFAATQTGFTRYGTEGFTRRTREVMPGLDHFESEGEGPRILAEQLALAYSPEPAVTVPANRTVKWWETVTLTATGTGTWSQTAGTAQQLTTTDNGKTITFSPAPYQTPQQLTFSYGGKAVTVTVEGPSHWLIGADGVRTPVTLHRVQ